MSNATEIVAQLESNLLTERGVQQTRDTLRLLSKSSPRLAEITAEVAAAEERFAREEPARKAKAAVARAGFRRSDRGPEWIRKNPLGRWEKYSAEQVVAEVFGS